MPGSGSTSNSESKKFAIKIFLARIGGILAPLAFLLTLCLVLSLSTNNFATRENIKQIAVQAAVVAILACGQTAVILCGNIDLSVGSIMAFSGVAAAISMDTGHQGIWVAVLIALSTGLICGLVNGMVTAFGKIPSFIVTLGSMGIWMGFAGIACHSRNVSNQAEGFDIFGFGEFLGTKTSDGLPYAVLIMFSAAIVVHMLLSKTKWGRAIYAIGGNKEAARLSGIKINKQLITVFALSGLLAGIAAVVNISRASVATKEAGVGLELDAVAATVVGGTSLFGGQGGIPGTIVGAFLIYTIRNGLALKGYGADEQRVIIGTVVILAVLWDRFGPGKKRTA